MNERIPHKLILLSLIFVGILLIITGLLYSSFALVEPIKSINFTSEKLNYNEKNPGSWSVKKSAEWIGKGKARITIDVDTILKSENKNTDIIFVLDISGSMVGQKLERVKRDSIELINTLLSDSNNSAALITFETSSKILSDFTNNKESLVNLINSLEARYTTNYYQALVNTNKILQKYRKVENKNVVVLFLTDGYPNAGIPNEKSYFKYLKQQYPYAIVNGIQYEMGKDILDPIKQVSDNQYIADMKTLKNVLFDASIVPTSYDSFTLTDYIDIDNFIVENRSDIKVSQGMIDFNKEEQKITWNIDYLRTGSSSKMTIDVLLKEEAKSKELVSTNKKEEVSSSINNTLENIVSDKTPILKQTYQVIYEGNAPNGCTISNVPETRSYVIFDQVEISDIVPKCGDYQFQGWEITTLSVDKMNDDYFIMPENDVIIRAEWKNLSLAKSMNGEVHEVVLPVLKSVGIYYSKELWEHRNSITTVIFQDKINPPTSSYNVQEFDVSERKNGGVMAYLVPNDVYQTTYTAYIQADGKIIANKDSSGLFDGFEKLESIVGLEYFDTSNAEDMSNMFALCYSLKNLDVSHFDTSKVTNMQSMFYCCEVLADLDVSHFDTSNVTNMSAMFQNCKVLTSLDVSHFNTSKVTNMGGMFMYCLVLTSLDLSNFDTSKVVSMGSMFHSCKELKTLTVDQFEIGPGSVYTKLMFYECNKLVTTINLKPLTITDYEKMFYYAATATGAKITVNYTASTMGDLIDEIIKTKYVSSAKVVKGGQIPESNITIIGNDDIMSNFTQSLPDRLITLSSISGNYVITGFKMNGILIKGNQFTMPDGEATITEVEVVECFVIESEHDPYPNSLSGKVYGEKTIEGANLLTVILDYQTEGASVDYIYLYDSAGKLYGKYGGNTRTTETITIPGNYVKITFTTNSKWNSYYGFKATIIPDYDPLPTITVMGNDDIKPNVNESYFGQTITLSSVSGNYAIKSFKMNGVLINGNQFTMPDGDAIVTEVEAVEAVVIESEHNPYPDSLSKVYGEQTFEGATSLKVTLEYQTQSASTDYIYLYDSSGGRYGKYAGSTRKTQTIQIPGNYVKIFFSTDSSWNDYYGFRAVVLPNYN